MSVARAILTGDLAELPSRRQEDWRWTDIRGLIRSLPAPSSGGVGLLPVGPFDSLADREVLIINGKGENRILVTAGATETIALRVIAAGGAGSHAAQLTVRLAERAKLTLLESYEGQATEYLSEMDIAFELEPHSVLERLVIAADSADAVSVSIANVLLGSKARLRQTVMTSGARRQRIETRVSHPGAEAHVRMDGVYVIAGRRHADITTSVSHQGVDGTTDQLTKGVVRDQARAVFQGRIVVSEGADRTDARMGHHALVLSDRAEVDAKPELEIFADDVLCAHGNTVGSLDEDALFYARQRGIPDSAARQMLTAAFLGEVVERIHHADARRTAFRWLTARLEASL